MDLSDCIMQKILFSRNQRNRQRLNHNKIFPLQKWKVSELPHGCTKEDIQYSLFNRQFYTIGKSLYVLLLGLKGFKNITQESLKWLAYLIAMLMLRDILKMNSERKDMRICETIKTRRQLRELQSRVSVLWQVTTNQSDEIIAQQLHLQLRLAINNNYNISNNFSDHAEAEYKTSINQSASWILHRPQSLIKKKNPWLPY